ncbi:MAG: hypothetical protein EHM21_07260 [Chloroflexi bacterium]|nr:MAG: hypothetical protein EHM21_07260 [Chloroflexota bacterium]
MEKIGWASKIRQSKIWQLYQNDALGAVDEALVEEVGYDLYQRCRSIWLVTRREVECPRCGAVFTLCEPGSWKMLPGEQACPAPGCGWETTAAEWHASWRHRDLLGTAAFQAVETYLNDYPKALTPEARMVCIDQLIHSFHISLRTGKASRSFANNLIEGSHKQVVKFLDGLSEKQEGVDKDRWRAEINAMFRRRRGAE